MAAILKTADVCRITTLSRTSVWRLVRSGELKPPVRLSPGRVGFLESDVEAFVASRAPKAGTR
jgi:prophage regulatory protein